MGSPLADASPSAKLEASLLEPLAGSPTEKGGDHRPAEASILSDPDAPDVSLKSLDPEDSPSETDEAQEEAARLAELRDSLRRRHAWAQFDPGAWRRMQVISESFDAEGEFASRSVTERLDRLTALDDETYTLEVESTVSLAGRPAPGVTETRRLWLLTDRPTELGRPVVVRGQPTSISLGDVIVPCRTWRISTINEGGTEDETLCVAKGNLPPVLRRESLSHAGEETGTQQTQSVTRLNMPAIYGDSLTDSWHTSTSVTHPNGARTERVAVCSADAPGAVHWEAVTEYDASGKRTHWAVAKLVASGRTEQENIERDASSEKPAVEIEIRPRRFLRMLRREQAAPEDAP